MENAKYSIVFFLLIAINACKHPEAVKSPPGYDLSKPQEFKLPPGLQEVSGISFKKGIADMKGTVTIIR